MSELSSLPTSIQAIYNWFSEGKLFVNRRYQRKLVWTLEEKQHFVDSILKKYPIPSVLIAEREEKSGTYEIIDGMQRLHTIVSFIEGAFPSLGGAGFDVEYFTTAKNRRDQGFFTKSDFEKWISSSEVGVFLDYTLAVSVIRDVSEKEVNDIFDRINTYGHRLSDQERRQAGVQNDFVNCVRKISCSIRGDDSVDVLPLSSMPSISIDLPMSKHGYEIKADEVFWVKNGILTARDLRDSLDEQCIADIVACIVSGDIIQRSKRKLDDIYDSQNQESDRILSALTLYGEDKVSQEIKYCIEQIECVCGDSSLKNVLFGDRQANAFPSLFAVLFFSFHDLLIKEKKKILNYNNLKESLKGIAKDKTVNTGKDATQAEKRKKNIKVIKGIINDDFVLGADDRNIYAQHTTIDVETTIRRSEIELPHYELKQGILKLDKSRAIDDKSIEKIIKTISAIANGGDKTQGKIILGVADKESDAERIEKIDQVTAKIIGRKKVVGVEREAKLLGKSLEEYFHLIRDKIRNSPLSEPLKSDCLSKIDFNSFYGLGVIIMTVPTQNDISYYGDEVYFRDGDQTIIAKGARQIADIAKRFSDR